MFFSSSHSSFHSLVNGPNGDENRGLDHHSLYGNHHHVSSRGLINSGSGVGSSLGSSSVGGGASVHGGHGHGGQNMLLIPQPMKGSGLHGSSMGTTNGSGRKYQCKMCPQVSSFLSSTFFSFFCITLFTPTLFTSFK